MNSDSPSAPESTAIDDVVNRIHRLQQQDVLNHVEVFEHAHQVLQEHLNEAVDG